MREPEWIVTGTGRCGTQFLSEFFGLLDIRCTHEGLFKYSGVDLLSWDGSARADSSWMAAPHLHRYHCPIIALLRDPAAVAQSLLGIEFFTTPGVYLNYLLDYEPDLAKMDPVNAAWQFYVWWNNRILPFADTVMVIAPNPTIPDLSSFTYESIRNFAQIVDVTVPEQIADLHGNQWLANDRSRASLVEATAGLDPDLLNEAYTIYDRHLAVVSGP